MWGGRAVPVVVVPEILWEEEGEHGSQLWCLPHTWGDWITSAGLPPQFGATQPRLRRAETSYSLCRSSTRTQENAPR